MKVERGMLIRIKTELSNTKFSLIISA